MHKSPIFVANNKFIVSMKTKYINIIFFLLTALLLIIIATHPIKTTKDEKIEKLSNIIIEELTLEQEYCISKDSFIVEEHKIKKNQNLADILLSCDVPYEKIDKIGRLYKDSFDVRHIRTGHKYLHFFSQKDSIAKLSYMIYEHTPIDYILFDFTDSISVSKKQKKIRKEEKQIAGQINSSLWNAIVDADANPMLAIDLSEVYAWSIDFFGLQNGDAFKVIYTEEFVGDKSIDVGNIKAAVFTHAGNDFYAIPFVQDSVESFFDENGNSLRKTFLKAPLRFSRISSRFSHSRLHPVLKIRRPHHGVDYAAPTGTPVYAIGDGKIIKRAYGKGGGNYVKIKHNSVYTTVYMHLSKFSKGLSVGNYVKQGELIGYVGSTGLSTGPHLDFRFYKNGKPVDPLKVESPPAEPIKKEYLDKFNQLKDSLIQKLTQITPKPFEITPEQSN